MNNKQTVPDTVLDSGGAIQQNGLCFHRAANLRQKRDKKANKQTNKCIVLNSDTCFEGRE